MAAPAFIPIGVDPPAPPSDQRVQQDSNPSLAAIVQKLRERSIDIDRLTCPKLIDQLLSAATRPIDVALCCLLDADPVARLNSAVAQACAREVDLGLQVIAQATNAQRANLVVDTHGPRPGRRAGSRRDIETKTIAVEADYPQMHPALLLRQLYKRALAPGHLPTERGIIMIDGAAAFVIGRMALGDSIGMPILVRDDRIGKSIFALAAPELSLGEIFSALHLRTDQRTLVSNGPRFLKRSADLDARARLLDPVIYLSAAQHPVAAEPCVRCNWCADVCPTGVLPMFVLEAAQFADPRAAQHAGARRCISCGLCDFVCPSRLPLLSSIQQMCAPLSPESVRG